MHFVGLDSGHNGFMAKENANGLEKKGTPTPFFGPEPACSMGQSMVKSEHTVETGRYISEGGSSVEACE